MTVRDESDTLRDIFAPHAERVLESYREKSDDELPAEMELADTNDGFEYRFRDTGLRLEIDGETYVPESVAPREGYVMFARESEREGMVKSTDKDIRIYADMSSNLVATGGDYDDE